MIVLPAMTTDQEAAWHGLLDLAERRPTGWTLVGGQMAHLHCAERGYQPHRSTPDVDTLVDVRAIPTIFAGLTADLQDLGFSVAGETVGGKEAAYVRAASDVARDYDRLGDIPGAADGLERLGRVVDV